MADFDPPFAYAGGRRAPTSDEIANGFPCGPLDRDLFNWLMYAPQAEIGKVIDEAGIAGSNADFTQLWQALNTLYAKVLTSNITFYVRIGGDDNNDGLTVGTAFATIQKAIDLGSTMMGGNFTIYIDVGVGTFAPFAVRYGGGNTFEVVGVGGDLSTGTRINGTGQDTCILVTGNGRLTVRSMRVFSAATLMRAMYGGMLQWAGMTFGGSAGDQVLIGPDAVGLCIGDYSIASSAGRHFNIAAGSYMSMLHTATLENTVSYSDEFINCSSSAVHAASATFVGSATGKRYTVVNGGSVHVGGRGVNVFPGNSAGTSTTGYYA